MKTETATAEQLRLTALFELITGAVARDCLVRDGSAVFVVREGDVGAAIGRGRRNINRVKEAIGMDALVVEYSDDAEEFVGNAFWPAGVESVEVTERGGERVAVVEVMDSEREKARGVGGWNLGKVRVLARRHHGLDDVVLA